MKNDTKNLIISLLSLYVLLDLGAAYMMSRTHPNVVNLFFSSFHHTRYLVYVALSICACVALYRHLSS